MLVTSLSPQLVSFSGTTVSLSPIFRNTLPGVIRDQTRHRHLLAVRHIRRAIDQMRDRHFTQRHDKSDVGIPHACERWRYELPLRGISCSVYSLAGLYWYACRHRH